ncbi:MAG: BF3164 family lipoprotein [Ignavibacterium sp.]
MINPRNIKYLILSTIILFISLYYFLFFEESIFKKDPVPLKKFSTFGNFLGFPTEVFVIDSLLIVIDKKPQVGYKFINMFSFDGQFKFSYTDKGTGPKEMINPKSIDFDPFDKEKFWIFDASLYRFIKLSLKTMMIENYISINRGLPYNAVKLSNGNISSLGYGLTTGRFALHDSTGQFIKEVGEIPPGIMNNIPIPVHLVAFQGKCRKSPDNSKIIISSRFTDMIEVYLVDGTLIKRFFGPLNKLPVYETVKVGDNPVMALDDKNSVLGYIDIFITAGKIYALYSGRIRPEYGQKAPYGNTIHVFDFEGNLKKIYKTDEDLFAISVTENDSLLFGVQHYDEVQIVAYKL